MNLAQAEMFFLGKIKNQAQKDSVELSDIEEQFLLTTLPEFCNLPENLQSYYEQGKLKSLNNKIIVLLRHSMQHDLKSASAVKSLRLGWLTWFKMPADWYDAYMCIYDNSNKYITGVLQNFVIGNPFE